MKIIATIFPTDLVTNSLLSCFCPFLQTKNKNQVFSNLAVKEREILLLFVYSKSHFKAMPNFLAFFFVMPVRIHTLAITSTKGTVAKMDVQLKNVVEFYK